MEIPVWMDDWEHECCGPLRRVGEEITMQLFLGQDALVVATRSGNPIDAWADGVVRIAGTSIEAGSGLRVLRAGSLAALSENHDLPLGEIVCQGRLWLTQHPTTDAHPVTVGRIRALRWHRSDVIEVAPHQFEIHPDFRHGRSLQSTDQRPSVQHWVFGFIVDI